MEEEEDETVVGRLGGWRRMKLGSGGGGLRGKRGGMGD